jgi:hypothetical protein
MLIRTIAVILVLGNVNAFATDGKVNESLTINRQTVAAEPKVGTILSVTPIKKDQLHLKDFDSATGIYSRQFKLIPVGPIVDCTYKMSGVATPGEPHTNLYLSSRYNWEILEVVPGRDLPPNRDGSISWVPGKMILQATGDRRLRLEITSRQSNNECLGKAGFPRPTEIREEKIKRQEVNSGASDATT